MGAYVIFNWVMQLRSIILNLNDQAYKAVCFINQTSFILLLSLLHFSSILTETKENDVLCTAARNEPSHSLLSSPPSTRISLKCWFLFCSLVWPSCHASAVACHNVMSKRQHSKFYCVKQWCALLN